MTSLEDAVAREDAYQAALELWNLEGIEHPMIPTDLGVLMRTGVPPAPMLLDDWLYVGELHWIYAEAEAGKTWVALWLALEVMKAGNRVAWFDEELGQRFIVERLLAIGADPGLIDDHFAYFPFPNMQPNAADIESHARTLAAIKPALVVYDTATDMLTAAGLDENSGREVTQWVKAFPEEARQLGIAQIVCDHTAKGGDTAVGSRAKRAKAKVQYYFKSEKRWDKATVGRLLVRLMKNTPGNVLPAERIFAIGGDGEGRFVFELAETRTGSAPADKRAARLNAARQLISEFMSHVGDASQQELFDAIPYATAFVLEVAKEMSEQELTSGLIRYKDGVKVRYRWVGLPELPQ